MASPLKSPEGNFLQVIPMLKMVIIPSTFHEVYKSSTLVSTISNTCVKNNVDGRAFAVGA
jgi:hypothetical protein